MRKCQIFPGRIVFDHLGKTGGQAINAWLINTLGTGCVTPNLIGDHRNLIRQYGGSYSIISGHLRFMPGELLDPRYQYVTLLREPCERTISWLFYLLYNIPESFEVTLRRGAKQFLETDGEKSNPEFMETIQNYYIRHFSPINSCSGEPESKLFDDAMRAVKSYEIAGVYDMMPDFLAAFSKLLGIPEVSSIDRVNVTACKDYRELVSEKLLTSIRDLNYLDIAFFEEVKKIRLSQRTEQASESTVLTIWEKWEPVRERRLVTSDLTVDQVCIRDSAEVERGREINFDVYFRLSREISELEAGIHIFDEADRWAFGTNSTLLNCKKVELGPGSYCASHRVYADLPFGHYKVGFAFAELTSEGSRELFWDDKLLEFDVLERKERACVGYCDLSAEITFQNFVLPFGSSQTIKPAGYMTAGWAKSMLEPREEFEVGVTITNSGDRIWQGDLNGSLNLSYRWLDQNWRVVVGDGKRSPMPAGGVPPGEAVEAIMAVIAPEMPGRYHLFLLPVLETVAWFDEMGAGFIPAHLEIEVRVSGSELDG